MHSPGHDAEEELPTEILNPSLVEVEGDIIDIFKLIKLIGRGGFGVVFCAFDLYHQRHVALKIFRPDIRGELSESELKQIRANFLERFKKERAILALLEHTNIARFYTDGHTDKGNPYFAMEYVPEIVGRVEQPGLPITKYCDGRKVPLDKRVQLIQTICETVHDAHARPIVHRDLKPANILISENRSSSPYKPIVKIVDFGLAKMGEGLSFTTSNLSHQFQGLGTPSYMPPEQAANGNFEVLSDIFSVGAVMFDLLTGTTPIFPFKDQELKEFKLDAKEFFETHPIPKPSTRIQLMSRERATAVASLMGLSRRKLIRSLKGDLDFIISKALQLGGV